MLRTQALRIQSYRLATRSALLIVGLCMLATASDAHGQLAPAIPLQKVPDSDPAQEPARSLKDWHDAVRARLKAAKEQLLQIEEEGSEPSVALKSQLDSLASVDLTLRKLANVQEKTGKLTQEQQQVKQELDQGGVHVGQSLVIIQLDEVRNSLRSEGQLLSELKNKEKEAVESADKARQDFKNKNHDRLLAKERAGGNSDDSEHQVLSEQLAKAVQRSEAAEAVAALSKQELVLARAAASLQSDRVKLVKKREDGLLRVAKFGKAELEELQNTLKLQKENLERSIQNFEKEKGKIAELERRQERDEQTIANSSEEQTVLLEALAATKIDLRVQKEVPELLRARVNRLSVDGKIWERRQALVGGKPGRQIVLDWRGESQPAVKQLKADGEKQQNQIDQLRKEFDSVEAKQKNAVKGSAEYQSLDRQKEGLRTLRENYQENHSSIQTSLQLHEILLSKLESDSLVETAKDQLHSLRNQVEDVWHYPLTSFGDKDDERVVTVQKVVTALLILIAGMVFSRALSRALGRQVLRRLDIDASASATIQSMFYYVLLLMFGLFALSVAKVPLTAFTVLGGAVALGIGFGSQNIINNFISGLILHAERPVKVGDLIQLDNLNGKPLYGNIEHIGARSTRVRTGSNLEIIVPNSSFLQNNVVNFTLSSDKVRTMVEVGVIYGSPTVTVTQLLRRAVIETGRVAKDPPPIILFKSFGDNSLQFEVHFWIRMRTMMDQMQIESAVRFRIDQLFREEGIVIAFPQSDVHLDTSSPLTIQMVEKSPEENPS